MNTKDIGNIGESAAAKFLKKSKYKILERNLHVSHNELDIVAISKKQRVISFVEVKTRTAEGELFSKFGTPAGAVTRSKQQRIIDAARGYLFANKKFSEFQARFDVIEVYLDKTDLNVLKINHIENAFSV